MRKLPIGIQDFTKLRQGGYLYVDKTEVVHRLVTSGVVYFLSRPRRFGKSLLVSTLAALFEGKRELFDGLWIAQDHLGVESWAFEPGPVVRLDMSAKEYRQGRSFLLDHLAMQLESNARRLGLTLRGTESTAQFANMLVDAHAQGGIRVAVLVDEYDKPLIETLDEPELHREMRSVLNAFYSVLKSADEHLRFTFLTGVTKFSQVSIFSDLNHLRDISRSSEYAEICGITQEELERNFAPEIDALALAHQESYELHADALARTLAQLRDWYDGYLFNEGGKHVYNPFCTLNVFAEKRFENYWFQSGTPTFLIRLLQQQPMPLEDLEGVKLPLGAFSEIDPERLGPIPILFQSGYLTIREYLPSVSSYLLGYPNREVRQSFVELLADKWAQLEAPQRGGTLIALTMAVLEGRVDDFLTHLRAFFANIPYDLHVAREKYYQTIFYLVFRLIGFNVQAEVKHATGRTDAIIETKDLVYLFEFKLDRASAEDALKQIDDKGYATPYLGSGKLVTKVGVTFDSELRNIERWVVG